MKTKTETRIKRPLNHETGEADCPQCGAAKSVARHNASWTCYKCGYCEIVDDDREAERNAQQNSVIYKPETPPVGISTP